MAWKKHRRLWCGLLAACCLTAGLGAAAADGGKTLATLSYLKNTFLPALEKGMGERAKQGTQGAYDAALAQLDGVGQKYAGAQDGGADKGWTVTETFLPTALKGGSTLTLDEGGSILWLAGFGTGTGLVDATAGAEVPAGGALISGHRYLNGQEGNAAVVAVTSDAAKAAPAGRWSLAAGDSDVTPFFDLRQSDWFYQGVRWAIGKGIFVGVSATEFDPGGAVTRGTLATVLHRLEGSEAAEYTGIFSDVPAGQWYTAGVEWAAAKGVVSGGGDGTFSPNQTATREQIAVMLCQYARYLELDVSGCGPLEEFGDNAAVSDWARDAVSWAVDAKIISGANGSLLPKDNATRAQVALMLQNFQKWSGRG